MVKHEFYKETTEGFWMIHCHETDGEFCTKIWQNPEYKYNECPCCKGKVRTCNLMGVV